MFLDRILFEFDHVELSSALMIESVVACSKYVSSQKEVISVGSLWSNYVLKMLVDKIEHIVPQISSLIICFEACRSHLLKISISKEIALRKVSSDAADSLMITIDALILAVFDHFKFKNTSLSSDSELLLKAISMTDYNSLPELLLGIKSSRAGGDRPFNTSGNNVSGEFRKETPISSSSSLPIGQVLSSTKSFEPRALVEVALSYFQEVQKIDTKSSGEIDVLRQELLVCFLSQKQSESLFDSYAAFWLNPLLLEQPLTHNRVLQPKTTRSFCFSTSIVDLHISPPPCCRLFLANPRRSLEIFIRVRRYN